MGGAFDFESRDSYSFAIKAKDDSGKSLTKEFNVKVTDVVDEAGLANSFLIDASSSIDGSARDFIQSTDHLMVQPASQDIDLTVEEQSNALKFSNVTFDLNNILNIKTLPEGSTTSPSVIIPLAKLPTLKLATFLLTCFFMMDAISTEASSDDIREVGERFVKFTVDLNIIATASGSVLFLRRNL